MPSLNFAWAVMFGIIFLRTPCIWLKVFGIVYPVITLFAITITANHYLTDAFGGWMVILVSFLTVEVGFKCRFFAREIANRVKQSLNGGSPLAV